jgi:hydroxymethylglutaryl-CoA reductase
MNKGSIKGFSKLDRDGKVEWLSKHLEDDDLDAFLKLFRVPDQSIQNRLENFSENTLSCFHLPWSIAPNFLIDGEMYHVPMVTEESSVVAAASKAASFWCQRGGFKSFEISTVKKGQLHFFFKGQPQLLLSNQISVLEDLRQILKPITANMERRGGGILDLCIKHMPEIAPDYFQLDMEAETKDSMGANFINTILEEAGAMLPGIIEKFAGNNQTDILMAILSNHTPESVVGIRIEAPLENLVWDKAMSGEAFAGRMKWASDIAHKDINRAVTHNKGIYNGVDAVVIATGNDFRAVEASGHAFASQSGKYRSLSKVMIEEGLFAMELIIPLALGVVGGLTRLHPMAARSLEVLGNPDAKTLMKIAASVGLASNFAALASLVTTGIQKGHMKMHLQNILISLNARPDKYDEVLAHFQERTVSVAAVREFLDNNGF